MSSRRASSFPEHPAQAMQGLAAAPLSRKSEVAVRSARLLHRQVLPAAKPPTSVPTVRRLQRWRLPRGTRARASPRLYVSHFRRCRKKSHARWRPRASTNAARRVTIPSTRSPRIDVRRFATADLIARSSPGLADVTRADRRHEDVAGLTGAIADDRPSLGVERQTGADRQL
jgi:hypothetical protein